MNRGNSQLSVATLDAFGNHCPAKLVSSRQKSLTSGRASASLAIKLLTKRDAYILKASKRGFLIDHVVGKVINQLSKRQEEATQR